MDWILIGIILFFVIVIALIISTLYNLAPLGDERRKAIQQEAGAFSFSVVVIFMLIEIAFMFYKNSITMDNYDGMNPFITLIIFSLIYLLSLWKTKRKYS